MLALQVQDRTVHCHGGHDGIHDWETLAVSSTAITTSPLSSLVMPRLSRTPKEAGARIGGGFRIAREVLRKNRTKDGSGSELIAF
jgi:hypothetical protein